MAMFTLLAPVFRMSARARRQRAAGLLALLLMGMLSQAFPLVRTGSVTAATPYADARAQDARIRDRIEGAIVLDSGRSTTRLPAVHLDGTSDLTVVVALRAADDLDAFRAAAEDDILRILRAIYATERSPVQTATVVGTYAVADTGPARESPVLRVVLSATNAENVDWDRATATTLFPAVDVYRFSPPFGDAVGNPIAPLRAMPAASPEDPVISSPIDIGDRVLFLRCIGSGGPTVILEAGYGDTGAIWAPVQIHASEFVRVCSHDRAGLERSDAPDHYPRTGADVVADLHAALQKADVQPPYLLVGHSYGALFSRLFAETYPAEVAALLWLDPWPLDYDTELKALVTPQQWTAYERLLAADPDNEVIDFPATYAEIRAGESLPDVPLLILSHGEAPTVEGYPPGWPVAQQERLWQRLEQDMATLTPQGAERVVAGSGHMIHQAKPYVVVEAIAELVDRLRREEPRSTHGIEAFGGA
jgi:pimeloyl-ACP methyl ester carboxylesterase